MTECVSRGILLLPRLPAHSPCADMPPLPFAQLYPMRLEALRAEAQALEIPDFATLRKPDLVFAIGAKQAEKSGEQYGVGVLEVHAEGFGFLRTPAAN